MNTVPGGCYLVNGQYVDANGKPVSAEILAQFLPAEKESTQEAGPVQTPATGPKVTKKVRK